jgi:hypothetical protein
MAKDAKGHGSEGRGGGPAQAISDWKNKGTSDHQVRAGIRALFGLSGDKAAAATLASGPKSAPVPTHSAMASGMRGVNARYDRANPGPYEGPRKGRWPKDVMKS